MKTLKSFDRGTLKQFASILRGIAEDFDDFPTKNGVEIGDLCLYFCAQIDLELKGFEKFNPKLGQVLPAVKNKKGE